MDKKEYYTYQLFGLNLQSDVIFPELNISNDKTGDFDLEISRLEEDILDSKEYNFLVDKEKVIFHVPNKMTFQMYSGTAIKYACSKNVEQNLLRLYLLGTCMGILLIQRNILPLHGSVIEIDGKAIAICGESGAGKSTLASVFLNRGFKLLTDDIIALIFNTYAKPLVVPSYPQQKLWKTSLNHFGMETENYTSLYERETKYAIPVSKQFQNEVRPLTHIFLLTKSNEQEITIKLIQGLDRIKRIYEQTYRQFLIPQLGLLEWHFQQSIKIINSVDFFKIERPAGKFTAYELADSILKTVKMGEGNVNKHIVAN